MTTEVKTYASKATAIRGGKRAGLTNPEVAQRADGRWIVTTSTSPLYNAELRVKSKVKSPVRLVWDICFANKTASRSEIVSKAIAAGVSLNTARTQYQRWREAEGLSASPKHA